MSKDRPGNQTPDTPDLSETELRAMKVDDLRRHAKEVGVPSTSSLRKDELVEAVSERHRSGGSEKARSGKDKVQGDKAQGGSDKARSGKDKVQGDKAQGGSDKDKARSGSEKAGSGSEKARGGSGEAGSPGDAGPEGGRLRTGDQSSKSLKYSQEVTSPDDEPERAGRSLATTSHEVIRQWAEARGGVPATVEGTEHGDLSGVLRFDFGGDSERLKHISWDEWFATFDERRLNFLYQEERSDGRQSTFFRLENPTREDA